MDQPSSHKESADESLAANERLAKDARSAAESRDADSQAQSNAPGDSTGRRSDSAPVLSRSGLGLVILLLMGTPILLIGAVWITLPPVSEAPLEARVSIIDFIDTRDYRKMSEAEKSILHQRIRDEEFMPTLVLHNPTDEVWRNVGVTINGAFDFFLNESLAAGQRQRLFLHRFQSRQGDEFRPLEYEIRKVRVFARLPSGERAFFECQIDANGHPVNKDNDSAS